MDSLRGGMKVQQSLRADSYPESDAAETPRTEGDGASCGHRAHGPASFHVDGRGRSRRRSAVSAPPAAQVFYFWNGQQVAIGYYQAGRVLVCVCVC